MVYIEIKISTVFGKLVIIGICFVHSYMICATAILLCFAGVPEGGACRIHRSRFETDKQLVHQSEETPLEAFRGYAICYDGCNSSPLLHGQYYVQSLSNGLHPYAPLIYFPSPVL